MRPRVKDRCTFAPTCPNRATHQLCSVHMNMERQDSAASLRANIEGIRDAGFEHAEDTRAASLDLLTATGTDVVKKPVKRKLWVQCTSTIGDSSIVFCTKEKGHEGDHRGSRAQWNDKGRVPITEKAR